MRAWGHGRKVMRDPKHPGWPEHGERTEMEAVARKWKRAYWDWCDEQHLARVLGKADERLARASKAYLAHRERVVEPSTLANDRAAIAHLWDDHGDALVHALNPQKTLDRLSREGYAVSTVRVYSAFLSSFWTWLELPYKVKLPKAQAPDVRALTDAEIEAVRKAAGEDLIAVDCGIYMGLREGEIFGLEWTDIDRPEWVVRVQRQIDRGSLKSKKPRTALILPGWTHEGGSGTVVPPRTRSARRRLAVTLLKDAGVYEKGMGWHVYRHTYARLFLEAHPDLRLLQSSLGHASVTTTETKYNHLLPDRAAQMARERIHGRGSGTSSGPTPPTV